MCQELRVLLLVVHDSIIKRSFVFLTVFKQLTPVLWERFDAWTAILPLREEFVCLVACCVMDAGIVRVAPTKTTWNAVN